MPAKVGSKAKGIPSEVRNIDGPLDEIKECRGRDSDPHECKATGF